MGSATVFVDDAVRGTLPGVCAKTGVATSSAMTIHSELGDRAGMGVAWLLVFAGPIGWLALLVISMSRGGRREVLTVQVPLSEEAYEHLRSARRRQSLWLAVALTSGLAVFLTLVMASDAGGLLGRAGAIFALGMAIAGVVGLIVNERRLAQARIVVDLDASRRWVTLSGVHPTFVEACRAHDERIGLRA